MNERQHLHRDDHPGALAILNLLFGNRLEAARWIGYEPTDTGAWVDWVQLTDSWLSSTEEAAVHIAHGCAIAERHGGLGPGFRWAVLEAITAVCRD